MHIISTGLALIIAIPSVVHNPYKIRFRRYLGGGENYEKNVSKSYATG